MAPPRVGTPLSDANVILLMRGRMIWFNEEKGFGFIRTDDGERLYVDRTGFEPDGPPVGRCAEKPVSFLREAADVERGPERPRPQLRGLARGLLAIQVGDVDRVAPSREPARDRKPEAARAARNQRAAARRRFGGSVLCGRHSQGWVCCLGGSECRYASQVLCCVCRWMSADRPRRGERTRSG